MIGEQESLLEQVILENRRIFKSIKKKIDWRQSVLGDAPTQRDIKEYRKRRRNQKDGTPYSIINPKFYDQIVEILKKKYAEPEALDKHLKNILTTFPIWQRNSKGFGFSDYNVVDFVRKYSIVDALDRSELLKLTNLVTARIKADDSYMGSDIIRKTLPSFMKIKIEGTHYETILKLAGRATGKHSGLIVEHFDKVKSEFEQRKLTRRMPKLLELHSFLEENNTHLISISHGSLSHHLDTFVKLDKHDKFFDKTIDLIIRTKTTNHYFGYDSIVESVVGYRKRLINPEKRGWFDTAIKLADAGVDHVDYLKHIRKVRRKFPKLEKMYSKFALSLGEHSKDAARNHLNNPAALRLIGGEHGYRFIRTGLGLVKDYGDRAAGYFNEAEHILKEMPEQFDDWITTGRDFSGKDGQDMFYYISHSPFAMKNGFLNDYIGCYKDLKERHNKFLRSEKKIVRDEWFASDDYNFYIENGDDPKDIKKWGDSWIESTLKERIRHHGFSSLMHHFTSFITAHEHGIPVDFWSELSWSLFNKKKDTYGDNVHKFFNMVKQGFEYKKLTEVFFDLVDFNLFNHYMDDDVEEKARMMTVINSDIHLTLKSEKLYNFSILKKVEGVPGPTLDDSWLDGIEQHVNSAFRSIWKTSPKGLTLNEKMKMLMLDGHDDDFRIQYLLKLRKKNKMPEKDFELGKEYGQVLLSGLKAYENPTQMALYLIQGLVGRDEKDRKNAESYFEPKFLETARGYVELPFLFPKIRDYMSSLRSGDEHAAKKVLHVLKETYHSKHHLLRLVSGIEGMFSQTFVYDALSIRMQNHDLSDMFDNRRIKSCVFYPRGECHEKAPTHALDRDYGILQIKPVYQANFLDPIGAALALNCADQKTKEKVLFVSSVEGGTALRRIKKKHWIPMVHTGLLSAAADNHAAKLAYHLDPGNMTAKYFINNLGKIGGVRTKLDLMKCHGDDCLMGHKKIISSMRGAKDDNSVRRLDDGVYIKAFSHAQYGGKYDPGGTANAIVFDIKK